MDTKTSCNEDRRHASDLCIGGSGQSSNWKNSIKAKLGKLRDRSLSLSIFKVPNKLRKVDEDAYNHRMVSIGPFHSSSAEKHDHMLVMEEQKWWYMLYFLQRTIFKTTDTEKEQEAKVDIASLLDKCSDAILSVQEDVRLFYAENIISEPFELAEMMLLDGCFILELFLRSLLRDFNEGDPIFQNAWMVPSLQHDLALLENQIPFIILGKLFDIVVPKMPVNKSPKCPITNLALLFFYPDLNLNQEAIGQKCMQLAGGQHFHLLDLLHNFYLPIEGRKSFHMQEQAELRQPLLSKPPCVCQVQVQVRGEIGEESLGFKECATKLLEGGIEFKKREDAPLFEIDFDIKEGDIKIPQLRIDEKTKSLLRNLIAFEQCLGKTKQHITSYAILLGSLIQSLPDLELLQKHEIITYDLKEVDDVFNFFQNIVRGVVPKNFCLRKLCEDVTAYKKCWRNWHRITASLKVRCQFYYAALLRDYFCTPWSLIACLAALLLLILTIMQTYYAARS